MFFVIAMGYQASLTIAVATPIMGIGFAVPATAIRSKRLAILFWIMTGSSVAILVLALVRNNYVQIPNIQLPAISLTTLQWITYTLGAVYLIALVVLLLTRFKPSAIIH
jgi:hypothetical protein